MREVDNRRYLLTVLIYKYCELALMQKKVKTKVQLASCDTIFYVAASSLQQFSRLDLVDQNFRLFIVSISTKNILVFYFSALWSSALLILEFNFNLKQHVLARLGFKTHHSYLFKKRMGSAFLKCIWKSDGLNFDPFFIWQVKKTSS